MKRDLGRRNLWLIKGAGHSISRSLCLESKSLMSWHLSPYYLLFSAVSKCILFNFVNSIPTKITFSKTFKGEERKGSQNSIIFAPCKISSGLLNSMFFTLLNSILKIRIRSRIKIHKQMTKFTISL